MSESIAVLGLGAMGMPMATALVAKGFAVTGFDLSEAARAAFVAAGGMVAEGASAAIAGASVVITILPDGGIVARSLAEAGGAILVAKGALVIDMSSSAPIGTRDLGARLAAHGVGLIDAPVSGGVARAKTASLTIMVGGELGLIDRAEPILRAMGSTILRTGALGSGHAAKALNNYVSAAGLAAASRALIVAKVFGIDPAILTDILNASTGRNNSTEKKLKPFILSGSFNSGFSLPLMAKDLRTAADLAARLGLDDLGLGHDAGLWTEAEVALGAKSDHTEIFRYLAQQATGL